MYHVKQCPVGKSIRKQMNGIKTAEFHYRAVHWNRSKAKSGKRTQTI